MNRTRNPFQAVVLCSCLALLLAACGQRGPLYLPEPENPPESSEEENAEEEADEGSGDNAGRFSR